MKAMKGHITYLLIYILCNSISPIRCMEGKQERVMHLRREYNRLIDYITQRAILKKGQVDRHELNKFLRLAQEVKSDNALGPDVQKMVDRIQLIYDQAPRAARILNNGYDIEQYRKILNEFDYVHLLYAAPLVTLQYRDWAAAVAILEGYPLDYKISDPSPFDIDYEQLTINYLNFAARLEQLGMNPSVEDLKAISQAFTSKFDNILKSTPVGLKKKAQLIKWLGGAQNYLDVIIAKKLKEAEIIERTINCARKQQERRK